MSTKAEEFTLHESTQNLTMYFEEYEDQLKKDIFSEVFPFGENVPNYEDEEDKVEEHIYINETKKITENPIDSTKKAKLFTTSYFSLQKKRGRSGNATDRKNAQIHDKYSEDNVKRKIQVHYLSCIPSLINDILKQLGYKEKFLEISYDFKKNVNNKFFKELKTKKIFDIICNKISKKYTKIDEDFNIKLYENLQYNEDLKNLFDAKYLDVFENIYLERNINFLNFGLDKKIHLSSDVKTFKDLKQNQKKEYVEILDLCVKQNFINSKKSQPKTINVNNINIGDI